MLDLINMLYLMYCINFYYLKCQRFSAPSPKTPRDSTKGCSDCEAYRLIGHAYFKKGQPNQFKPAILKRHSTTDPTYERPEKSHLQFSSSSSSSSSSIFTIFRLATNFTMIAIAIFAILVIFTIFVKFLFLTEPYQSQFNKSQLANETNII